MERPKVPRQKWRILEPREVPRAAEAFTDARARLVFLTLTLTGLRRQELRRVGWRHVNLVEGTLRVEESKSDEGERSIALPSSLVARLVEYLHLAGVVFRDEADALERRLLGAVETSTDLSESQVT